MKRIDICKDIINKDFIISKDINKILIIGDLGSCAYPVFRWIIWNATKNSNTYLWVDEHGNEDFVYNHIQEKHNIDVAYYDSFSLEIIGKYDGVFLNDLNGFFIEKFSEFKRFVVLRVGVDVLEKYSLSKLKLLFDLIIIANPHDNETRRKIMELGLCEEIGKFKKLNEVVLIYKDIIKHTEVLFPKHFPFNFEY